MPGMAAIRTARAPATAVRPARASLASAAVSVATALAILGVALLPLLTPLFLHPLLDAASSAAWLVVTPQVAHELSDRTVAELVFGPGTFAFAGPTGLAFYSTSEASHLREARTLFLAFEALALGSLALVIWAAVKQSNWSAIARGAKGLVIGVVVVGVVGFFAFEPAFELFHRIFFPGGNWAFDPLTSGMVRLYPYLFWELAAASLGALAVVAAAVTWLVARRRSAAIDS
jgi:integral membrane protein (TIGR01906 family)